MFFFSARMLLLFFASSVFCASVSLPLLLPVCCFAVFLNFFGLPRLFCFLFSFLPYRIVFLFVSVLPYHVVFLRFLSLFASFLFFFLFVCRCFSLFPVLFRCFFCVSDAHAVTKPAASPRSYTGHILVYFRFYTVCFFILFCFSPKIPDSDTFLHTRASLCRCASICHDGLLYPLVFPSERLAILTFFGSAASFRAF